MKENKLLMIAEYVLIEEMRKFNRRIQEIINDIYKEFSKENPEVESYVFLEIIEKEARSRFNLFYPKEPFFDSIFYNEFDILELRLLYDDVEEDELVQIMQNRRIEENQWEL